MTCALLSNTMMVFLFCKGYTPPFDSFSEVNLVKIQTRDRAPVEKQSHDEHHVLKVAE
jgi:hypothetical protein